MNLTKIVLLLKNLCIIELFDECKTITRRIVIVEEKKLGAGGLKISLAPSTLLSICFPYIEPPDDRGRCKKMH